MTTPLPPLIESILAALAGVPDTLSACYRLRTLDGVVETPDSGEFTSVDGTWNIEYGETAFDQDHLASLRWATEHQFSSVPEFVHCHDLSPHQWVLFTRLDPKGWRGLISYQTAVIQWIAKSEHVEVARREVELLARAGWCNGYILRGLTYWRFCPITQRIIFGGWGGIETVEHAEWAIANIMSRFDAALEPEPICGEE